MKIGRKGGKNELDFQKIPHEIQYGCLPFTSLTQTNMLTLKGMC